MTVYKNLIGGEWTTSTSSQYVPNINPANFDEVLGEVPMSSSQEALAACEAAQKAFKAWRNVPAPTRGDLVYAAARLMRERKDTIALALTLEEGKLLAESHGELEKTIKIIEYAATEGRRLNGETVPLELANNFGYTIRSPVGVCALITPWNFPVALPSWKIAPALVSGNTVVLKPSTLSPDTGRLVVECFVDVGLPAGVVNMVYGSGSEVGTAIIDHPATRAVSFTGSTEIGSGVYVQAAKRGIRAQCEMGGKNPVIVLDDADLDLAVTGVIQGAFGSTGQRCTATSRIIIMESVADTFLEKLLVALANWRAGNGMSAGVHMGPVVGESQMRKVLQCVEIAQSDGAKLIHGGTRLTDGDLAQGFFVAPTIFDRVTPAMRIAREEVFGPVLAVLRVGSFDEAIAVANDVDYGLTSSIYTNNLHYIFRYVNDIQTGMTHVNSPTLGGEAQMPFGGMKASAVGPREQGSETFDFYTETKAVYIDYTGHKREGRLY